MVRARGSLPNSWSVLFDGSSNATTIASAELVSVNESVDLSPAARAARVVALGGAGAQALGYLDEGEDVPSDNASGDGEQQRGGGCAHSHRPRTPP